MDRFNVSLINVDVGYGDIGCFGSTLHETPHVDRLATENVQLNDFYVTAAVCAPPGQG